MARKERLASDQRALTLVAAARKESYQLVLTCYCDNPDCAAREFEIRLKDYDGTVVGIIKQDWFCCPICRTKKVNVHAVETWEQYHERAQKEARESVNVQRRVRDERARNGDGLVILPMSAYCDDSLPT